MSDAANAKAISAILRAIGNADEAKERKTDVVFLEAAKLIDAAYGTSPTPPHPAQSSGGAKDAPVAWRLKYNGCDLIEVYISEEEAKRHARNYNAELQPLYLHPSPPEPSDAAVEADAGDRAAAMAVRIANGISHFLGAHDVRYADRSQAIAESYTRLVEVLTAALTAAYAVDRGAR